MRTSNSPHLLLTSSPVYKSNPCYFNYDRDERYDPVAKESADQHDSKVTINHLKNDNLMRPSHKKNFGYSYQVGDDRENSLRGPNWKVWYQNY